MRDALIVRAVSNSCEGKYHSGFNHRFNCGLTVFAEPPTFSQEYNQTYKLEVLIWDFPIASRSVRHR